MSSLSKEKGHCSSLLFFFTWEFGVLHFGINKEEEGLEVAGVFIWLSLHHDP